jgi:hypothetical protein
VTLQPRWSLQRHITLGVLMALLVQTSGALIWFGQVGTRIDQLERQSGRQVDLAERLAGLEAEMRLVRESLIRIERRLDD